MEVQTAFTLEVKPATCYFEPGNNRSIIKWNAPYFPALKNETICSPENFVDTQQNILYFAQVFPWLVSLT
jgi:hypothetical protein